MTPDVLRRENSCTVKGVSSGDAAEGTKSLATVGGQTAGAKFVVL